MTFRFNDQIRQDLERWEFPSAGTGSYRQASVVSPLQSRLPSFAIYRVGPIEHHVPLADRQDSIRFYRQSSSVVNSLPTFDQPWFPSIHDNEAQSLEAPRMSGNRDHTTMASEGHSWGSSDLSRLPCPPSPEEAPPPYAEVQDPSGLEILSFFTNDPDAVYLKVKFTGMEPVVVTESAIQRINEQALVTFWARHGSREMATGVGKRDIFRIMGYRVIFLPGGNEREEVWIHWSGYLASQGNWIELDLVRAVSPEKIQMFNNERRLSYYGGTQGEMFTLKDTPRCGGTVDAEMCPGCMGCGGGCK